MNADNSDVKIEDDEVDGDVSGTDGDNGTQ